MTKKVYFLPSPEMAARGGSNGIDQVVLHLTKYLPSFGYEVTENPTEADLMCPHAGSGDGNSDVAFCHGLYPTGLPDYRAQNWELATNAKVIADITAARRVIVPSQWVADILRRDMHLEPHVIGWGVEAGGWVHEQPNGGYVLWNKNRAGDVCDPSPMNALAAQAPNIMFVSTFGDVAPNVKIIGSTPHKDMRILIQSAAVYLATTKETYGIGTLEALAAGTPVLGYKWGSTADLVQHGVNGFLVEPGDIKGLAAGLAYCILHRDILSANAQKTAQKYTWRRVAKRVAAVFDQALAPVDNTRVSVVIPCFNYGRFLAEAVGSVYRQQTDFVYEVTIVDDGSTDNTPDVIKMLQETYPTLKAIRQANKGVAEARNAGIRASKGDFIVCLDADDMMREGFLQVCFNTLQKDRQIGIAFTGLQIMGGDVMPWPNGFDYERQLAQNNQVPSLCMFRKSAWERAGGYRKKYTPAEDGELWLRITSYGFKAVQATKEPLFLYRDHPDSLTAPIRRGERGEPGWTHDKPWRDNPEIRPFAAGGTPPHKSWKVRNYDRPDVSVIIAVGPYHTERFRHAVDSVESQTFWNWECIVVNDSGAELDYGGLPFIREIKSDARNAAKSRNMGIKAARGEFVVFLDADDAFMPTFMQETVKKFRQSGGYVYTDWIQITKAGAVETAQAVENASMSIFHKEVGHLNVCLIPRNVLAAVGGFDETFDSWEDVELYMKLATVGLCGVRVPSPLVVYNYQTGMLREQGMSKLAAQKQQIQAKYREYIDRRKSIVCSCEDLIKPAKVGISEQDISEDMVRVRWLGPRGKTRVQGLATKTIYGKKQHGDRFIVYKSDYEANREQFEIARDYQAPRETHYDFTTPEAV